MFGLTFTTQHIEDFFAPFKTCNWKQKEFVAQLNGPNIQEDKLDKTKEYLRVDSSCIIEDTFTKRAWADKNTIYYPVSPKTKEDLQDVTTNCLFPKKDLMPNEINVTSDNCRFQASVVQWNHDSRSWVFAEQHKYNGNFVRY